MTEAAARSAGELEQAKSELTAAVEVLEREKKGMSEEAARLTLNP